MTFTDYKFTYWYNVYINIKVQDKLFKCKVGNNNE